jgi:hypothetical protein
MGGVRLETSTYLFYSYGLEAAFGKNLWSFGGNLWRITGYLLLKPIRTPVVDIGIRVGAAATALDRVLDSESVELDPRWAGEVLGGLILHLHFARRVSLFAFGDFGYSFTEGPWRRSGNASAIWAGETPDPLSWSIHTGLGLRVVL